MKRMLETGDTVSREHVSYDSYLGRFTAITAKLIKRDGPFGTHSNRKTAYLFAVWGSRGNDIMIELMASARHKDIGSAAKYKKEASFLLAVAEKNNLDVALVVSEWTTIFCGDEQLGRSLNVASMAYNKPLYELATEYIYKYCGYSKEHPCYGVQSLLAAALDYRKALTLKGKLVSHIIYHFRGNNV